MVRRRPGLVAELLGVLGCPLPDHESARIDAGDLTELVPTEYRADAVVVLRQSERPVLGVIVEVQLARDSDKRWTWPVYVSTLRARLRCPVMLLVLCPDDGVAMWCGRRIDLGHPGAHLVPLVLGPPQVPIVDSVADAVRSPELAVLSALAHGADPAHYDVVAALGHALATLDGEMVALYSALVQAALPEAARRVLEDSMFNLIDEHPSEAIRKVLQHGRSEGRVEGRAESVLAVLDARGIAVPDDVRERIAACTDVEQLDIWVRAAVTVASAEDLFA